MIIRLSSDADAELAEARQWYAHQREDLDLEFMDSVDEALTQVVRNPHFYPSYTEISNARWFGAFRLLSFMTLQRMRFRSLPFSIRVEIRKLGSRESDSTAIRLGSGLRFPIRCPTDTVGLLNDLGARTLESQNRKHDPGGCRPCRPS